MYMVPNRKSKTTFGMQPPLWYIDFWSPISIWCHLHDAEVEDGLQIKIGDQKSMYHRVGCMPKEVLDFRFGTIYTVN